jgi:hypothetical protein
MALAGRGSEIKEYVLGVELFGRGDSFDPQTHAIVRTEVSRLRAKLRTYYSTNGRDDPMIIDLPTRSYTPVFKSREALVTDTGLRPVSYQRRWLWISAVLLVAGSLIFYESYWLGRASATGVQSAAAGDLTSVAVLPFVNSDGDRK